jgi:hypothetical protein
MPPVSGHLGKEGFSGRREALEALLGDQRTGDLRIDLIEGLKEAMRRRARNAEHGGVVIAALVDMGLSYRDIEHVTELPRTAAQRWAIPPERKRIAEEQ